MTRTLIGFDYTDTPCVKITKGSYDPVTTLDSRPERFFFSSKWANNVEAAGIDTFPAGISSDQYFPSGTNANTFLKAYRGELQLAYWKKGFFTDLRYDLPMYAFRRKNGNGRWDMSQFRDVSEGASGGYRAWGLFDADMWSPTRQAYLSGSWREIGNSVGGLTRGREGALTVFNLPGDNTALDGPSIPGGASSGTPAILITPDELRVAKAGYSANWGARYMAFSSDNSPIQVIAGDDIAMPGNTTVSYTLPISVDDSVHVEITFYDVNGSNVTYPATTLDNFEGGIEYWISGGDTLNIRNPNSQPGRARFFVLATDARGKSSGSYNVLRHFTWNGERHVQFLRPGASSSPRLADIALDSRFPALQILKEGYFTVANGAQTETISFDSAGYLPYVMFMLRVNPNSSSLSTGVRPPFIRWDKYNARFGGDTAYCIYSASQARFYTYKGRAAYAYRDSSGDVHTFDPDFSILGIRYYVFGIPT